MSTQTQTPPTSPLQNNDLGKNTSPSANNNNANNNQHKNNKHNKHHQKAHQQHQNKHQQNGHHEDEEEEEDQENQPHQQQQQTQQKHKQEKQEKQESKSSNNNNSFNDLLGDDMQAVKQVISFIPFSNLFLNTSVYLYQHVTPQIIQKTVETQVLPRTNPLLNQACEFVAPQLEKAATIAPSIYTYVLDRTHSTLDYVLPPLSKAKPMTEETEKAAKTVFEIPTIISSRVKQRFVEVDMKETMTNYLNDFVTKVETSQEADKEASIYRLLSDMLVILQTTPLPSALPKNVPLPKVPTEDATFNNACGKLIVDSKDLALHFAHGFMERYHAGQSQLLQLVQNTVKSMTPSFGSSSSSSSPAATTTH